MDLWSAWKESSGLDIPSLMASWTEKMGYPLLTVSNIQGGKSFDVKQNWFLADGTGDKETKLWTIPMSVTSSSSKPTKLEFLKKAQDTFAYEWKGDWIKLNAGQPTMCRVLYPESMYPKLVEACRTKQLGTVDRVGIVNDAYNLCKIGKLSPATLLQVLTIAEKETEYAVWVALDTAIRGVFKALNSSGDKDKTAQFRKWASSKLIAPIMSSVGWSPKSSDGHDGVMLRALVINLAGDLCEGDPKILMEASKRFNALCVSIANGGDGTSNIRARSARILLSNLISIMCLCQSCHSLV